MSVYMINVVNGDFLVGEHHELVPGRRPHLEMKRRGIFGRTETIRPRDIASIDVVLQSTNANAGTVVGGAAAGGLLFGVIGAAAGALLGARGQKTVTFECRLRDGRKFTGTALEGTYLELRAAL